MAQDTQYAILMYSLGITYSEDRIDRYHEQSNPNPKRDVWRERTRVNASLADISDSSTLHHVPNSVSLDGLIFAYAARAVRATHKSDVATAFLVATAISSFLCLWRMGMSMSWCSLKVQT